MRAAAYQMVVLGAPSRVRRLKPGTDPYDLVALGPERLMGRPERLSGQRGYTSARQGSSRRRARADCSFVQIGLGHSLGVRYSHSFEKCGQVLQAQARGNFVHTPVTRLAVEGGDLAELGQRFTRPAGPRNTAEPLHGTAH